MSTPVENQPEGGSPRPMDNADLHLCVFTAIIAVGLFAGASVLPPPTFDPLGSAAVPKAVAVVLAGLALLVLMPYLKQRRTVGASNEASLQGAINGAGIAMLALIYAGVLDFRIVPFWLATLVFIPAAGAIIRAERAVLIVNLIIGLILGVGGQWIFTKFFYMDLPV